MLRILGFGVLGLQLIYLLGANVVLNFFFHKAFESTNQINASFRRAFTLWPGTVHFRELRVVFQDHNVQFSIDVARGVADVRLTALASRVFHATRLNGEGLVFRMRHRIQPDSAHLPWVSALPPIPEFSDPPLFESRVPEPPIPDDQYELWTIHLENVAIHAQELWAQFARYRGPAVATGAFRLRPARELWVGPAQLELENGVLSLGDAPLAKRFGGTIRCTVHPFDVRKPEGNEVFRYISSEIALTADGMRLDPATLLMGADAQPKLRSDPGTLRLSAQVERGVFTDSSQLAFRTPEVSLDFPRLSLTSYQVDILAVGLPDGRGQVRLAMASGRFDTAEGKTGPHSARILASVQSSSRDTTQAWTVERAGVHVDQIRVDDLGWFAALQQPDAALRPLSGSVVLSGRAEYAAGRLAAVSSVHFDEARLQAGSWETTLDTRLNIALSDASLHERSGHLAATMHAASAQFRGDGNSVSVGDLDLDAEVHAVKGLAQGKLGARLGTLSSRSSDLALDGTGRLALSLHELDLEDLAARISGQVTLARVSAKNQGARFTAPRIALRSELRHRSDGAWDGQIHAEMPRLSGRVGKTWWRAQPRFSATLQGVNPSAGTGVLDTELIVKDLVADDRAQGLTCPFARLAQSRLRARLNLNAKGGGNATLQAQLRGAGFTWDDFRASGAARVDARLEGLSDTGRPRVLSFQARVRDLSLRSGSGVTSGWQAQVPALLLSGRLAGERRLAGGVRVEVQKAQGRVGRTHVDSALRADMRLSVLDMARREGRFDARLRLTQTNVRVGDESVDNWWATIRMRSALLQAADNLDLSTLFEATMRDALPGLAVLSAEDEIPGWLVDLVPLRALTVTGAVHRRCRLTDVQFTEAEGGPLRASGRLHSTSDAVRGAFLVRLASMEAVSTGLSIRPDTTNVSLFAGTEWLQTRMNELDAAARSVLEQPCPDVPRECEEQDPVAQD